MLRADPNCMHTHAEPVSHNTYNSCTIKEVVWCYEASITCFYGNISLILIIVLQVLLNDNLQWGNVKLMLLLMQPQTVLHVYCLVLSRTRVTII